MRQEKASGRRVGEGWFEVSGSRRRVREEGRWGSSPRGSLV